MTENKIIKRDVILKIGAQMKTLRKKNDEIANEVDNIITDETKAERHNLEKAVEIYNKKVQSVMASQKMKDKLEEKYECDDKITELMTGRSDLRVD